MQELAASLGVEDRLHVAPPVSQDRLVHYLSGADVAVHPMPGGSPNHDQALPNKLFEYLHAGLPLVVSDARLMAEFVTNHEAGEVFVAGTSGRMPRLAAVSAPAGASDHSMSSPRVLLAGPGAAHSRVLRSRDGLCWPGPHR